MSYTQAVQHTASSGQLELDAGLELGRHIICHLLLLSPGAILMCLLVRGCMLSWASIRARRVCIDSHGILRRLCGGLNCHPAQNITSLEDCGRQSNTLNLQSPHTRHGLVLKPKPSLWESIKPHPCRTTMVAIEPSNREGLHFIQWPARIACVPHGGRTIFSLTGQQVHATKWHNQNA